MLQIKVSNAQETYISHVVTFFSCYFCHFVDFYSANTQLCIYIKREFRFVSMFNFITYK